MAKQNDDDIFSGGAHVTAALAGLAEKIALLAGPVVLMPILPLSDSTGFHTTADGHGHQGGGGGGGEGGVGGEREREGRGEIGAPREDQEIRERRQGVAAVRAVSNVCRAAQRESMFTDGQGSWERRDDCN